MLHATKSTRRPWSVRDVKPGGGGNAGVGACALAVFLLLTNAAPAASSKIAVEQPWMRFIIKSRPASGYFILRNNGDVAAELTGAFSPACGMLMLHLSKEANGVEQMLPVKSVNVPAHGTVSFKPGGYHLMCMHPKPAMRVGHSVPVTLTFAGGAQVSAQFPVKGVK